MAPIRSVLRLGGVAAGVGFCAALSMAVLGARQNASAVRVDPDDIGGVVTGAQATWHIEGGRGTRPKALHFQMRPDPLSK